jgi:cell division inhibitor SepF
MRCGRFPSLESGAVRFAAVHQPWSRRTGDYESAGVDGGQRAVQRNARDWRGLVGDDGDAPGDKVENDDENPSDEFAVDNGIQIAVVRPRNFRDAVTVGDYYRQDIPVIVNLEDMDNASATRIIDFLSGLILGLYGDLEKLSRRTFLIVPAGATIITVHEHLTEEGFFNQA